jgi:hypothetical protein
LRIHARAFAAAVFLDGRVRVCDEEVHLAGFGAADADALPARFILALNPNRDHMGTPTLELGRFRPKMKS